MTLRIEIADFDDPALVTFLQAHLDELEPVSPPESRHALSLDGLRRPGVRTWVARQDGSIAGTIALAPLEPRHEELKSMRTDPARRGQGLATALLAHALADARRRDVARISLETGSAAFFAAARALYRKHGFIDCAPFGPYSHDPHSVFLTRLLDAQG